MSFNITYSLVNNNLLTRANAFLLRGFLKLLESNKMAYIFKTVHGTLRRAVHAAAVAW